MFDGNIGKNLGIILVGVVLCGGLAYAGSIQNFGTGVNYFAYGVVVVVWLLLIYPVGGLIGHYLKKREPGEYSGRGIEEAGKLIGKLERTIVLVFYFGRSLEGIAFLVVAKSIYRFGDLQKGRDVRGDPDRNQNDEVTFSISEYIILGSLMSYTAAILGGVFVDVLFEALDVRLIGFSPD